MKGNITLTMIKPDAMQKGYMGKIIDKFIEGEFTIVALKMVQLNHEQAEKFYLIHKDRPFYNDLVNFMSSGPITAAILQKENAVEAFRAFIGATDPAKAEEGSIRKLFGSSIQYNAVHGSDSDENAWIESSFFFNQLER
ncbi:MAG: nucleoside-diphosphate kinase [Bacteroidales bacterium]